jgi:hypothetical protein
MIRKMIAIALTVFPAVSFAGNSDIQKATDSYAYGSTQSEVQAVSSTPFSLAHKYWIRACARSDSSYGRAIWVLDSAFANGEISQEQYESPEFLGAVESMLFTSCGD